MLALFVRKIEDVIALLTLLTAPVVCCVVCRFVGSVLKLVTHRCVLSTLPWSHFPVSSLVLAQLCSFVSPLGIVVSVVVLSMSRGRTVPPPLVQSRLLALTCTSAISLWRPGLVLTYRPSWLKLSKLLAVPRLLAHRPIPRVARVH